MGSKAAIMVRLAMIVGVPTSSTASGMISLIGRREFWMRRLIFSVITMPSSTSMPMEKISANSDTRLRVKPQAQENTRVSNRVINTAMPTMSAWRHPMAISTSNTTHRVADIRSEISLRAFCDAVSP